MVQNVVFCGMVFMNMVENVNKFYGVVLIGVVPQRGTNDGAVPGRRGRAYGTRVRGRGEQSHGSGPSAVHSIHGALRRTDDGSYATEESAGEDTVGEASFYWGGGKGRSVPVPCC